MDNLTKQKLTLLAKGYGWYIFYEKHTMFLQRGGDTISFDRSNNLVKAKYPEGDGVVQIEVEPELIFDLFFELTWYRNIAPRYRPKKDKIPLNHHHWVEAWGYKGVETTIIELERAIKAERVCYRDFGGNIFLVEYAHGLIILSHDLCWKPTNVLTLEEAKVFHGLG